VAFLLRHWQDTEGAVNIAGTSVVAALLLKLVLSIDGHQSVGRSWERTVGQLLLAFRLAVPRLSTAKLAVMSAVGR